MAARTTRLPSWSAAAIACGLYTGLLLWLTLRHVLWRDESEVWLIARASSSIPALLHNIRYEGHPALWYLVQYVLTRITADVAWMKAPNFVCAVVAAGLVLSAARLRLWMRIGIVFSYFMVFEYGLIARNYMIGIVFLIAAARRMEPRDASPGTGPARPLSPLVPWLLALAALTSLPGLVVSMCLGSLYLWLAWRAAPRRSLAAFAACFGLARWLGLAVYTVSALIAAAAIKPPPDSGLLLESKPPHISLLSKIAVAGQIAVKAYVPIPLPVHRFWNTLLIDRIHFRPEALLGLLLIAGLILFFRSTAVRCFFVAASGIEVAQLMFSGRATERHVGWLFVIFLLALLVDRTGSERRTGWRQLLAAGLLFCQVAGAIVAVALSARYPFSSSLAVADYLVAQRLDRAPLAFEPFFVGQSVLAYLPHSTGYSLEEHISLPFVLWDREEFTVRRAAPTLPELQAAGLAAAPAGARLGAPAVLITEKPLAPADTARLHVRLQASFEDAICPLDNYYVYR